MIELLHNEKFLLRLQKREHKTSKGSASLTCLLYKIHYLNGIVKCGLVLDVHGVDVDLSHVDEEPDELRALDRVDEARAAEVIGSVHIGTGSDQTSDNVLNIKLNF